MGKLASDVKTMTASVTELGELAAEMLEKSVSALINSDTELAEEVIEKLKIIAQEKVKNPEYIQKQVDSHKGQVPHNKGVPMVTKQKDKISKTRKERFASGELSYSDEYRQNMSKKMMGRQFSEASIQKMSESQKKRPKVECRYCKKMIAVNGIKRHEEKCQKEQVPKKDGRSEKFVCPVCGVIIQGQGNFKRHLEKCQNPEGYVVKNMPLVECSICGKLVTVQNIKSHEKKCKTSINVD